MKFVFSPDWAQSTNKLTATDLWATSLGNDNQTKYNKVGIYCQ